MSNETFRELFSDPEAPATALLMALIDTFGTECLNWESQTLWLEIESAWRVKPPQEVRDKVNALVVLMTTNQFYTNLDAFSAVCSALYGRGADPQYHDFPGVHEMCWAVTETHLVDEAKDKFAQDIADYAAERLKLEGWNKAPAMLRRVTGPWQDAQDMEINDTLTDQGGDVQAYWKTQKERELSLNEDIMGRLARLAQVLAALPLQHGKKEVLRQFQGSVEKARAELPPSSSSASAPSLPLGTP